MLASACSSIDVQSVAEVEPVRAADDQELSKDRLVGKWESAPMGMAGKKTQVEFNADDSYRVQYPFPGKEDVVEAGKFDVQGNRVHFVPDRAIHPDHPSRWEELKLSRSLLCVRFRSKGPHRGIVGTWEPVHQDVPGKQRVMEFGSKVTVIENGRRLLTQEYEQQGQRIIIKGSRILILDGDALYLEFTRVAR
jgi:hypothetical protein